MPAKAQWFRWNWRPQFSLRSLFVFTILCAAIVGPVTNEFHHASATKAALARFEAADATHFLFEQRNGYATRFAKVVGGKADKNLGRNVVEVTFSVCRKEGDLAILSVGPELRQTSWHKPFRLF